MADDEQKFATERANKSQAIERIKILVDKPDPLVDDDRIPRRFAITYQELLALIRTMCCSMSSDRTISVVAGAIVESEHRRDGLAE
jgi:hypothetical protein